MVLASFFVAAQAAVTFEAPAAPLSRLLPQLGKTLGTELSADQRLKNEVLLLQVKGVSRDELLRQIAETTGGEWVRKDQGLILSMSASADAKQKRADAIGKGEAIRANYAKSAQRNVGSFGGLADAVFAQLPAETLGSIGIRQRIVYSTNPVGSQRRLSPELLKGLDLTRVRPTIQREVDGVPVKAGPLHTLILILGRNIWGDGPGATLLAADASGTVFTTEPTSPFFDMEARNSASTVLTRPDARLDMSPALRTLAVRIADSYRSAGQSNFSTSEEGSPTNATYSQEELAASTSAAADTPILAPDRNEPLDAVLGEGLRRVAQSEEKNLIALLPDEAFGPSAAALSQGALTGRTFEHALVSEAGLVLTAKDGWLSVKPKFPSSARAFRANRAALGQLAADIAKTHRLSLDQQAAYANAQPLVPKKASLEGALIGLIDMDWGRRLAASSEKGERELYRIVYGLGGSAKMGASRTFGSLPPAVRTTLSDLFFGSEHGPTILRVVRRPDGTNYETEDPDSGPEFMASIATDRTTLFPSGIPSNAVLSFASSTEDVLIGWAPNGLRPILTGEGVGTSISGGANNSIRAATTAPRLASYVQGKLATYEMSLGAAGSWNFSRSLFETRYDEKPNPIAFADLPDKYRKQIETAEKNMSELMEKHQSMRDRRNRQRP